MRATGWMALLALAAAAGPAVAEERDTAGERVIGTFAACRSEGDAAARLACFDKAAATLEAAITAREVRIVDKKDVRTARRSLFGFALPRINLFGGDDEEKEPDFVEINSTVAYARPAANNRAVIGLADESKAVWQTTDPMPFPPKAGAKIRIRKGALGNYFLNVDGKNVRGQRIR